MKESIKQISQIRLESVSPKEWVQYKEIWLAAVTTDPQAFANSFTKISNRTEQDWIDIIDRNLNPENNTKIITAKTDTDIVGMAGYYSKDENSANIYGVYVRPEYRGKGISTKIMQALLNLIANNKKFTRMELGVNIGQTAAIELYKRFGFKIIRVDKDVKMGDGKLYDEYVMEKLINDK